MRFCSMIFVITFSAFMLVGCSEEKPVKEVKTVEWYLAPENKAALEDTLKQCNNNPGQLKDDPNCINAALARQQQWADRPAPKGW